jgi:hypothetical protein
VVEVRDDLRSAVGELVEEQSRIEVLRAHGLEPRQGLIADLRAAVAES